MSIIDHISLCQGQGCILKGDGTDADNSFFHLSEHCGYFVYVLQGFFGSWQESFVGFEGGGDVVVLQTLNGSTNHWTHPVFSQLFVIIEIIFSACSTIFVHYQT